MPSDELKAELVRITVEFNDVLILTPRAGESMLQSIGDTFIICTVITLIEPVNTTSGRMDNPTWEHVITL